MIKFDQEIKEETTVEEESLLEKYAPVLYFHPDEQFFPTTIDAMLEESDLRLNGGIIDPIPVDVGSLSAEDVTEDYYLDMVDCICYGQSSVSNIPNGDHSCFGDGSKQR